MRFFIILLLGSLISACDRPEAEPEKRDPLYLSVVSEEQSVRSQRIALMKELEGFEKDLLMVAPQTGQIKYAQKRVFETQEKITKLEQLEKYWKLKAVERKAFSRRKYLEAYSKKETWPNPEEYQEYLAEKKLIDAPRAWNVKSRLAQEVGSLSGHEEFETSPKASH